MTTTTHADSTIPTGTWQSDPIHSSVGFAVKHVVGTFRGNLGDFAATLSDASGSPQPEIIFESKEISTNGDKAAVEGELTVKGITKPVVARGEIAGPAPGPDENDRLGIDLVTLVDRHDFGLDWQMDLPGGGNTLGDDVTLTVHVELVKVMGGSSTRSRGGTRFMREMKVLAISGSLRRDSHNTELARAAAELLPPSAELEIFLRWAQGSRAPTTRTTT